MGNPYWCSSPKQTKRFNNGKLNIIVKILRETIVGEKNSNWVKNLRSNIGDEKIIFQQWLF